MNNLLLVIDLQENFINNNTKNVPNSIKKLIDSNIAKPIVYLKRTYFGMYKPFDFNDDKQVNTLIHEICHLIKRYGKLKVKNGKIIDSTGLMRDTYSYSQKKLCC